jgi:hypothetical protein
MLNVNIHTTSGIRSIEMAETWNELSDTQIMRIAAALFENLSENELSLKLVRILMDYRYKELIATDPDVMLEFLFPLVEWIKTDCTLTEQKIPHINTWWGLRKYYGPNSALLNLRFCEWDAAERALYDFTQGKSIDSLYQFVAVLYRPARKTPYSETDDVSDKREAYNYSKTPSIAKALQKALPLRTAYAILLWYKGCRQHINSLYPTIFEGSSDEADNEEQQPFFFPLMRSIAKTGIYGDLDKVEQLYLYTTLEEMVAAEEERQEVERAMRTNKSEQE